MNVFVSRPIRSRKKIILRCLELKHFGFLQLTLSKNSTD